MRNKTLIEFHILQNYAASNLNRDDTGSVKDVIFGGIPRARISSQCLKRSIRKSDVFYEYLEKEKLGFRTRYLPEKLKEIMIKEKGFDAIETEVVSDIFKSIAGGSGDVKDGKKMSSQLIFLSKENVDAIIEYYLELKKSTNSKIDIDKSIKCFNELSQLEKAENKDKEKIKTKKENYDKSLKEISKVLLENISSVVEEKSSVPVDVALFGRMTTNQPIRDINASCQVAHAFSVNKHAKEFDYFTAVDDLLSEYTDDPGSGHLGETEFTSACFYKYISIDFDSLVDTLKGDKTLALNAVCGLLKSSVFSNPTGKQNSFASHTLPHFIGIEIKDKKIPVNYCNAFIVPVGIEIKDKKVLVTKGNWLEESAEKLTDHAVDSRKSYSLPVKEKAVFDKTGKGDAFGEKQATLDDLESWLKDKLK